MKGKDNGEKHAKKTPMDLVPCSGGDPVWVVRAGAEGNGGLDGDAA